MPSCPLWRHRNDMQNRAIASVVTRKNMDKQFNGGLLVDTMHKHSIRPKWITVIVIVIAYLLIVLRSLSLPIIYHISIIWDYFDICEICVKLVGYLYLFLLNEFCLSLRLRLGLYHEVDILRLGMDKRFHPTLYNRCDYSSMLGLKLSHVSVLVSEIKLLGIYK